MAGLVALAEVRLWDRRVGAVAEEDSGAVTFEYDPEFAPSGLEISPVHLPLSTHGPVSFPELRAQQAFDGLPGVLADSLPDRFGNAIIRKYFADRGKPGAAMSPVRRLLYMGHRAMGALQFEPAMRDRGRRGERQALEVAALVEQARRLVEGSTEVAIPEMMRVGSSAGGARPKAVILWNRETAVVRSGLLEAEAGEEHWILKFDGVGDLDAPDPEPRPYNRIEYAYSVMAREAGLDLPPTHLLEERRLGHFLSRRFDRDATRRLHLHSLGGMHHVDFNVPGQFSYEQLLRTVLTLNLGYEALEEAYRRAVFNVLAINQDDHVKNVSFLMDESGEWRLAPAYDLTFARGAGYTRVHQMTLAGKSEGIAIPDLVELAAKFDIKRDGARVIEQVRDALQAWPEHASAVGVPRDRIDAIAAEMRARRTAGFDLP